MEVKLSQLLCQNRRIEKVDAYWVEKRDFVPGIDRGIITGIVGPGGATAWWTHDPASGQRRFHIGVEGAPPDKQEIRFFQTLQQREKMARVVPLSLPSGFRVRVWWDEPTPFEDGAGERVCTLCVGVVRDAAAVSKPGTDDLDTKNAMELMTIAGREGAKKAKATQSTYEIAQHIRDNREKKTRKETPSEVGAV